MTRKNVSIERLKEVIAKLKISGKKIVLCHGVFDLLHIGHINHFQEAKNYGDILVVTVTSDQYVNKGPNRPAFDEQNRITALAALKVIDYVALNRNPTAISAIKELKPDFYCKGPDYKSHDDDISGKTNTITSGNTSNLRTVILFRHKLSNIINIDKKGILPNLEKIPQEI